MVAIVQIAAALWGVTVKVIVPGVAGIAKIMYLAITVNHVIVALVGVEEQYNVVVPVLEGTLHHQITANLAATAAQ